MADAIRMKEQVSETGRRAEARVGAAKRRARHTATQDAKAAFEGKVFSDLTAEEKDDLLKRLAIMAGLVEE